MKPLKQQIFEYWNRQCCGTDAAVTRQPKYSKQYFDDIEQHRYTYEPEIFSFAQFSRFRGKKVLEVGVGAGTDFLQWVRSGAQAYGVDLTPEAVEHVKHRLAQYQLTCCEIKVADSGILPYPDNCFDLVYSWGVIHHAADPLAALKEIVRVTRPGGLCKIMVYHRHSITALFLWVRTCLLRLNPWHTLSWAVYHHQESIGTQSYTLKEIRKILSGYSVGDIRIDTALTTYEKGRKKMSLAGWLLLKGLRPLAFLLGWRQPGWFMKIQFEKLVG